MAKIYFGRKEGRDSRSKRNRERTVGVTVERGR